MKERQGNDSQISSLLGYSSGQTLASLARLACLAAICQAATSVAALDPALPPGGNFDLSHWKLTLPGATGAWVWKSVSVTIASTGLHQVNLWMREDGAYVDRLILSLNSSFTPTGNGPAETAIGVATASVTEKPDSTAAARLPASTNPTAWSDGLATHSNPGGIEFKDGALADPAAVRFYHGEPR
jgi:hypothetical protein